MKKRDKKGKERNLKYNKELQDNNLNGWFEKSGGCQTARRTLPLSCHFRYFKDQGASRFLLSH
jgi:hypothetical protein